MITFHDLYEQYSDDVYRFAYWLCGNAMDADDITAETFVRAWTSKSDIRTATVKAYLLTIARNLYLEQQRKARRRVEFTDRHQDPGPGPVRQVEARLDLASALAVIQSLSEVDRSVFLLRVQHDMPYAEIARSLEISISAAKVKVHRARLKLAAAQAQEEKRDP